MEKKNTILLTVIAVATLLVAVVGSTFAFFAVQAENNTNVTVQTKTAASDVFNATGSGAMSLTVNNENMQQAAANDTTATVTDTDDSLTVTLKAGSGVATCTYDLVWTETSATKYAKTVGATKEFTLAGTSSNSTDSVDEINVDGIGSKLGSYTITNKAADANTTTQKWTFTTRFYNLTVDQKAQFNKTYSGNIKVANVKCTNAAN